MYSACGPQVDVFLLDEQTGALRTQEAVQSFALVNQEDMHKGNSQMDFGGLRHGGHVSSDEIQNDCMSLTDDALRYFAELRSFSRRNKVIRGGHVSVFSFTNGLDGLLTQQNLYSGRNCVWLYHVDKETGLLKEASKNIAKRGHDGPRHAWPHPNGKIVYSLQEHSSYVDVLELTEDGQRLEWLEGVDILPEGGDCHLFWADGAFQ